MVSDDTTVHGSLVDPTENRQNLPEKLRGRGEINVYTHYVRQPVEGLLGNTQMQYNLIQFNACNVQHHGQLQAQKAMQLNVQFVERKID